MASGAATLDPKSEAGLGKDIDECSLKGCSVFPVETDSVPVVDIGRQKRFSFGDGGSNSTFIEEKLPSPLNSDPHAHGSVDHTPDEDTVAGMQRPTPPHW